MAEPEAAVAIVQAHLAQPSVLLMRRAEREGDSWSGHWSFPGGRRDATDADPLCTAIRELAEECGVRVAREQLERALPLAIARRKTGNYLLVAPFVFRVDVEFSTVLNPSEAVESVWVPISVLLDPCRHELRPVPGRPPEMLFPAIDLRGVPLWGFTYRLITSWLGLAPDGNVAEVGLAAANAVLAYLVECGLTVERPWEANGAASTALVSGAIPVERVLAHFAGPGDLVPSVNYLDVRPAAVRIAGPAWEEYIISSQPQ